MALPSWKLIVLLQLHALMGQCSYVFMSCSGTGNGKGVVYQFSMADGTLVNTLEASDGVAGDLFGEGVSADASRVAVTVADDDPDNPGTNSGTVYFFDLITGAYQHKLTVSEAANLPKTGRVGIASGLLFYGHPEYGSSGLTSAGKAYSFDAATRQQVRTFEANDAVSFDMFGSEISTNGVHVAISAPTDANNCATASRPKPCEGSVYLFEVSTGTLVKKLVAPDATADNEFGKDSIAMSEDYLVVGAQQATTQALKNGVTGACPKTGAAYVFDAATGAYKEKFSDPDCQDVEPRFGRAVAVSGNMVVVGAPKRRNTGGVFLFDISKGNNKVRMFYNDDIKLHDNFGASVAIADGMVVVGAFKEDTDGTNSGAVYIFNADTGDLKHRLAAPNAAAEDYCGSRVRVPFTTVVTIFSPSPAVPSPTPAVPSPSPSPTTTSTTTSSTTTTTTTTFSTTTSTTTADSTQPPVLATSTSCLQGIGGTFVLPDVGHIVSVKLAQDVPHGNDVLFACGDYIPNWTGDFTIRCVQGSLEGFHSRCIATAPEDLAGVELLQKAAAEAEVDGPPKSFASKGTEAALQVVSVDKLVDNDLSLTAGEASVTVPSAIKDVLPPELKGSVTLTIVSHSSYSAVDTAQAAAADKQEDQQLAGLVSVNMWKVYKVGDEKRLLSVSNLTEPILITVPFTLGNDPPPPGQVLTCGFWDPAEGRMSTAGVETRKSNGTHTVCASRHLTLFGIFFKSADKIFACTAFLLWSDMRFFSSGAWGTTSGILLMAMFLFSAIQLVAAIRDDCLIRKRGIWDDAHFLTSDSVYFFERKKCCRCSLASFWHEAARIMFASELGMSVRDFKISLERRKIYRRQFEVSRSLGESEDEVDFFDDAAITKTVAVFRDAHISWEDMLRVLSKANQRPLICQWWGLFIRLQPVAKMTMHSMAMPRYLRVLIFSCRLYGSLWLACVCYLLNGKVTSGDPQACTVNPQGIWVAVAFGIFSFTCSHWMTGVMQLHRRHYIFKENWTKSEKNRKLRIWWTIDILLILISSAYVLFCVFVIGVFLGKVSRFDNDRFFVTIVVGLLKDGIITPFIKAVILVTCLKVLHSRPALLEKCRQELRIQGRNDGTDPCPRPPKRKDSDDSETASNQPWTNPMPVSPAKKIDDIVYKDAGLKFSDDSVSPSEKPWVKPSTQCSIDLDFDSSGQLAQMISQSASLGASTKHNEPPVDVPRASIVEQLACDSQCGTRVSATNTAVYI